MLGVLFMSLEVFILSFVILTLVHPIGDFIAPRRFKGEYWLVLNPLHILYDLSPLRRHHHYHPDRIEYWRWLGVDQFMHVILNLVFAAILELIF